MVVDGPPKKFGLLIGKGDRHGLGFDFTGPAESGGFEIG
jgi:hypothetical protein